jgi:CPA1 family monovalent cation:H+ antiporter
MFAIAVVALVLTALLAYFNARFIGLPTTIGVMAIAMLMSLALVLFDHANISELARYQVHFLRSIDFSQVLMEGMLSILLFAGALHIDLAALRRYRWQVGALAVIGTVASTFIVGLAVWWLLPLFGLTLPLAWCLLFGALISPTDPIAVIGILKSAGASGDVGMVVSSESLFNDGVGIVLFTVLFGMAGQGVTPSLQSSAILLLQQAGGGLLFGGLLGWLTFLLLGKIDDHNVEVLLTLACVLGGYELAHAIHVSGPLAMVVVGLIIGNHGRNAAMSETTRLSVDMFWGLLDEILNAVLFMLIGLEIAVISFPARSLLASLCVIVIVLGARLLTVGMPVFLMRGWFRLPAGSWKILTWGGLRGGISVALALSLPLGNNRDLILTLTYAVVVFSILGQGLTIKRLIAHTR